MRKVALIAFGAAMAAFVALAAIPFLRKHHDQPAAITSPAPLQAVALDVLKPGQQLCMSGITIDPHSQQARFRVGTYGKPGPPLSVRAAGTGLSQSWQIPGRYPDNELQVLPVRPPAQSQLIRVCVRNQGRVKAAVYSAADRTHSRANVTIGKRSVYPTPTFGFWEARPRTIAERAPLTAQRIAVFRGPLGYTWVVWLVAALTALALTGGLALALAKSRWTE